MKASKGSLGITVDAWIASGEHGRNCTNTAGLASQQVSQRREVQTSGGGMHTAAQMVREVVCGVVPAVCPEVDDGDGSCSCDGWSGTVAGLKEWRKGQTASCIDVPFGDVACFPFNVAFSGGPKLLGSHTTPL